MLPDQHQAARVPVQELELVAPLRAEDDDHAGEGILAEHLGRQRRQGVCATAEIHGLGRQQHAHAGRDGDHGSEARTARSTAVSSAGSTPGETHTTAPASATSIAAPEDAGSAAGGSATIGTNSGGGGDAGPAV